MAGYVAQLAIEYDDDEALALAATACMMRKIDHLEHWSQVKVLGPKSRPWRTNLGASFESSLASPALQQTQASPLDSPTAVDRFLRGLVGRSRVL